MKPSTLWKIRGKAQWAYISKGKTFSHAPLWIKWCEVEEHKSDPVRLGFAVSKKYGNAVARNKFKRRAREIVRRKSADQEIPKGLFLLIGVSTSNKNSVSNADIEKAVSAFIYSLK